MNDGNEGFFMFLGVLCATLVIIVLCAAYNIGKANGESRVFEDCRRDGFSWGYGDKYECRKLNTK